MTETGSFEMLPPNISLFSSALSVGSSFGELYAWQGKQKQTKRGIIELTYSGMTSEIQLEPIQLYLAA